MGAARFCCLAENQLRQNKQQHQAPGHTGEDRLRPSTSQESTDEHDKVGKSEADQKIGLKLRLALQGRKLPGGPHDARRRRKRGNDDGRWTVNGGHRDECP